MTNHNRLDCSLPPWVSTWQQRHCRITPAEKDCVTHLSSRTEVELVVKLFVSEIKNELWVFFSIFLWSCSVTAWFLNYIFWDICWCDVRHNVTVMIWYSTAATEEMLVKQLIAAHQWVTHMEVTLMLSLPKPTVKVSQTLEVHFTPPAPAALLFS